MRDKHQPSEDQHERPTTVRCPRKFDLRSATIHVHRLHFDCMLGLSKLCVYACVPEYMSPCFTAIYYAIMRDIDFHSRT